MTAHDNDMADAPRQINIEQKITQEARLLRKQEVENQRRATELRLEIGRCLSEAPDPGSRGCQVKGLSPSARRTAVRLADEYEAIRADPALAVELPKNHLDGDFQQFSRALSTARKKGEEGKSFMNMIKGIGVLDLFRQDDTDADADADTEKEQSADDDAELVPNTKNTEVRDE